MTIRLSFDRFEGKGKHIAVLVADDGTTLNVPKPLFPPVPSPATCLICHSRSIRAPPPSSKRKPGACRTSCRNATRVEISSCDDSKGRSPLRFSGRRTFVRGERASGAGPALPASRGQPGHDRGFGRRTGRFDFDPVAGRQDSLDRRRADEIHGCFGPSSGRESPRSTWWRSAIITAITTAAWMRW